MKNNVVFDEHTFFYQSSKEIEQISEHTGTQTPNLHQIGEHTNS